MRFYGAGANALGQDAAQPAAHELFGRGIGLVTRQIRVEFDLWWHRQQEGVQAPVGERVPELQRPGHRLARPLRRVEQAILQLARRIGETAAALDGEEHRSVARRKVRLQRDG